MKDAQKPDHVSLNTLISRLKEGRFVIPDFQREFEWRPWDIKDLMRSIFLDYYIGSLLLWKGKKENYDSLSCEAIYGFDNKTELLSWEHGGGKPEHIVLDGQQRLTAMYYAFVAPEVALPYRVSRAVYFINVDKFMQREDDKAFGYDWLSRRSSKFIENPDEQYKQHIFPLSVIGAGRYDLPNWLQGYTEYWRSVASNEEHGKDQGSTSEARRHAKNAKSFGEEITDIAEQYQIAYVELDNALPIDKVCDIFTKINSTGNPLSVFDLINALLKPKGLQLKSMWREAKSRLEFVDTDKMDVYVLQVMSILQQSYCSPKYLYYLVPGQEKTIRTAGGELKKEILISDIDDFKKRWGDAVDSIEFAIDLLKHPHEFGAISTRYLPYVSILPVFAALQSVSRELPADQRLGAQHKIRHWYWASVFDSRYSGSVESTSARDFVDMKAWIKNDDARPALFEEFEESFRGLDLRKEIKKGTSVYNGIFNLLIRQGARDWVTGNVPQHGDLDDHHIVPASWGNKHLKAGMVHTILNRTPLSSETNREVIRNALPNKYLPDLIKSGSASEVRTILDTHFISLDAQKILLRDPFGPDDYEAFITERQRTILGAIENLLIKAPLDLSPPLRELDQVIEAVELELRRSIAAFLDDDPDRLPPHVAQRIDGMIQRATNKNVVIDSRDYTTLEAKLDYVDLRELQEIITSKATWDCFKSRFINKETLNGKFDQLAELRNSIRHSRTVTEIVRKEGEAAILWFKEVLNI
jgi:hypothetical protein